MSVTHGAARPGAALAVEPGAGHPPGSGAPARSLEQRRAALRIANRIRSDRAAFKRRVVRMYPATAVAYIAQTINAPPQWAASWYVHDFLVHLPGVGRERVSRFIVRERISPRKTLGGISERQRGLVLGFVDAHERVIQSQVARIQARRKRAA